MAITKLEEPYVKVDERIHDYPVQLNIDGNLNIGGVIVAPTGSHISYVAGPKDFLEKFTVDGSIPRNADRSFINAYYLSFSSGLVISRSMNTTAVNGIFFTVKKSEQSKLLLNADNEQLWGILFNGVYYWCNGGSNSWTSFIETVRGLYNDDGAPLFSSAQLDKLKSYKNSNQVCTDFNDLSDKIEDNLNNESSTKYSVAYSASVGGILVSPGISNIFQVDNQDMLDTLLGLSIDLINEPGVTGLEGHNLNFKNGVALTQTEVLEFDFTQAGGIKGNWAFAYGSMAYYHGAIDKSIYSDYSLKSVKTIDDIANSICGMAGMTAEDITTPTELKNGRGRLKISYSEGNRLYVADADSGLIYKMTVTQPEDPDAADDGLYMTKDMYFAIYPKDPQDSNKYKAIVQPDEDQLFQLTLSDGATTESYTVSLLSDALDQTGNNAFIENLNALKMGYTIITNPDIPEADLITNTPKMTQAFSFGDSGLDLSASSAVQCMINALYDLEDQELYDIEYLAPMGIVDLQFIKNYTLVGRNNDWFTPVDIPWNRTNANSIKGYFLNVDDSSNVIALGPFDKNTGLTGWMNLIAASTLFYTRVYNNANANSMFCPVFDTNGGIMDYTFPCYELGKTDRKALLNAKCPINFVKYDQKMKLYYMNDNWTHQTKRNIVSEEQNRRMVNYIKKACKRELQRFKGRLNTVTTRQDVVTQLNTWYQSSLAGQNYHPNEFRVDCNEDNNPVEIINANKLAVTVKVRLENAIKYIDAFADVFPLGVDFDATLANG